MNDNAAKNFANYWYDLGYEISYYQDFWRDLLHDVFGIEKTTGFIEFQKPIHQWRIDAYIPLTKVLIEHKSSDINLDKTVYEQAKRYADALPDAEKARWIITCNFLEFKIYKSGRDEPNIIKLRDLRYQFPRLKFLIDPSADDSPPEEKISAEALAIINHACTFQ